MIPILLALNMSFLFVSSKLITVLHGKIYDVCVDCRKNSKTFGKHFKIFLSEKKAKYLFIPKGFAHGFQTLKSDVEMLYFHSDFHSHEHEGGLRYDDPGLAIDWPLPVSKICQRDQRLPLLCDLKPIEL